MNRYFISLLLLLIGSSFIHQRHLIFIPDHIPAPIYELNAYSEMQIQLGRALFYDPILSRDSSISCSTCHNSYHAFAHVDHRLSHGIDDKIGKRNAPALFNLAWQKNFMWDGAANHPEVQPISPISNPDEMDENLLHVVEKLSNTGRYPPLFQSAFGNDSITGQRVLKALGAFQLSLTSFQSKYDLVKAGKSTFTEMEISGYRVFKQHCNVCHCEPLFSSFEFANNGLPMDEELADEGRMKITGESRDSLLFKIPSLRNLRYSSPYMHDGRFSKISEVLNHYENGIVLGLTLSAPLKNGIQLSNQERVELIAFLNTLNDSSFVFNPAFQYPKHLMP